MDTPGLLVELILSWIEQREKCAGKLKKLAEELETHRKNCNISETVGSSVAVAGSASLIGAGVFTLLTGGLAAPLLVGAAEACSVAGAGVSMGTKITEHCISKGIMEEAQKIAKDSNEIAHKINQLLEQLKQEVKKASPFADEEEVDRLIMAEIVGAFARKIDSSLTQFLMIAKPGNMRLTQTLWPVMVVSIVTVLAFFTFGGKQLSKQLTKAGVKTALKGETMVLKGAVGLMLELPEMIDNWKKLIEKNHVTEASQSLRDTAEDMLKMTGTLREQLENIKQRLEYLSNVKSCIENSNRNSEEKEMLIEFAIERCEDETVRRWLRENSESEVFFKLVDMFCFLKQKLDEEKKKIRDTENIHIIFVAHGSIEESMISSSCLLPLPTIKDVLLYSPWNCYIDANAAYGIATGHIKPQDREFKCGNEYCGFPDEEHQPAHLPDRWNSMKEAGGLIPNIQVSTLRKPVDGAWKCFQFLEDKHGQPGRNRVVIPFILPDFVGSVSVPFFVITLALSLVLSFSGYRATVHLAACLGKSSDYRLNEDYLKYQYACTIDHTCMTCSEEKFSHRHPDLYRALKAVFG